MSGFYEFLLASSSFSAGAIDAFASNFFFGAGRHSYDDVSFQRGQMVGDAGSIVAGLNEALTGGEVFIGGTLLDLTGEGAVIGVPVQIVSTGMVIQGGTASALGFVNLMEANRKGGGKTGKKINQKREESLRKDLEKAIKARDEAKTSAEKKDLQKLIRHLRLKLGKSETHWR